MVDTQPANGSTTLVQTRPPSRPPATIVPATVVSIGLWALIFGGVHLVLC